MNPNLRISYGMIDRLTFFVNVESFQFLPIFEFKGTNMSKTFTAFLIMVFSFTNTILSQTIPNGDFEYWNGQSVDELLHYPINTNTAAQSLSLPSTVSRVSDPHDGAFAVQVKTVSNGTDTIFGYFANGDPNTGAGGIAYPDHPITLSGYYKCNLPSDTALLFVLFKENGVVLSANIYPFSGVQNAYTYFYVPLTIPALANPDSVVFGVVSCNPSIPSPSPGSYIQLDHLVFNGGQSQPVNFNGSFEYWSSAVSWDLPDWENFGDTAIRSTDAHAGNTALRLTTFQTSASTASPTVATTGRFTQNSVAGGRPFTSMIDTVAGWYKFQVNGVDSAVGVVLATSNGNAVGVSFIAFLPTNNYTYFEIPIVCGQQPDSLLVAFVSSADNVLFSNAGSVLLLDEIHLKSSLLAVAEINWNLGLVNLYPNPATNSSGAVLEFVSQSVSPVQIKIMDANGQMVLADQSSGWGKQKYEINTAALPPGMYAVLIEQDGNYAVRTLLVQ
jgi:Secretion system C-terminal sorting domain